MKASEPLTWCGNGSLAAQQLCKPCLFRSRGLVWFQSLSALLPRRRGDSWVALVGGHPARQKPWWRLAAWAQLALQHLVRFISTALTPESRSLLFVLFIESVHVPFPCFCSLMPSHLSSCFLVDSHSCCISLLIASLPSFQCSSALAHPFFSLWVRWSFFSLAAFHSLAVLVLLYPRAKHISSIGHSEDQWRGKAQDRLKSREGEREGEGRVAVWKCNKKEIYRTIYWECNSANMYVQSVRRSEKKSAKTFIWTLKARGAADGPCLNQF